MLKHKTSLGKIILLSVVCASIGLTSIANAQTKLYRYLNEQGVVVIDYSIPADYVSKGYDILNSNGQVLEKIEPEATGEELAQKQLHQKTLDSYLKLKRRYSDIRDIEQARDRKLSSLATNISILEGNIAGLNKKMSSLVEEAAKQERMGRKVSDSLLSQIDDTKIELDIAQELLNIRMEENKKTTERYSNEIERFTNGKRLVEKMNESAMLQ